MATQPRQPAVGRNKLSEESSISYFVAAHLEYAVRYMGTTKNDFARSTDCAPYYSTYLLLQL